MITIKEKTRRATITKEKEICTMASTDELTICEHC
jgi:hypothetical protein